MRVVIVKNLTLQYSIQDGGHFEFDVITMQIRLKINFDLTKNHSTMVEDVLTVILVL